MLEKVPGAIGARLPAGPGLPACMAEQDFGSVPTSIRVTSQAFADGGPLPARFTEDGDGISPPLAWSGVPDEARSVVLLIEDVDAPAPKPLVHAIVFGLPGQDGSLTEAGLPSKGRPDADGRVGMGKNSFFGAEYLPPDPPTGHGPHRYVVQVFALDREPHLSGHPGRTALVDALRAAVLAKGVLIGTYERS